MNSINILWIDDEIELLKPHILFLEQREYQVTTINNGNEALEILKEQPFDIIFLDENMPGLGGLEVLSEIKQIQHSIPVVMITKNEEEYVMEEAIGSQISDYLIKPVNPNQILLSLKKILDHSRLISEKSSLSYQQSFQNLSIEIASANTYTDWIEIYKKLVYWELQLEHIEDQAMLEVLNTQKQEANIQFSKFIETSYSSWFSANDNAPVLSHQAFKRLVAPQLKTDQSVLLIVIDNLRLDQWLVLEPLISKHYTISNQSMYYSILPTATQYARNAFFAGKMPINIKKYTPEFWKDDHEEGGKNNFEAELLQQQLKTLGKSNLKWSYHKIVNVKMGEELQQNFKSLKDNDLNVMVYNFVDMLSHAKTDTKIIKELASTDKAYRSLTKSWFLNSSLLQIILQAQELRMPLMITTDHGTINVKKPSKVVGDKCTSLNLRYKTGKSLSYTEKDVLESKHPKDIQLPSSHINSSFIFAKSQYFFAYPNNYNHYVSYYKDTYQHGGISLEEMIIPFISFVPK